MRSRVWEVRSGPLILICEGIGGEQVRLGRADGLGLVGFTSVLEKVHVTSLNFHESSLFLPELQTRQNTSLNFLKPFILGPVISSFEDDFVFFFFIYFG